MDIFQAPSEGVVGQAATPAEIARFVVGAAVNAPSLHNTQPWWFAHDDHEISVHADTERQFRVADRSGRDMMISCGAALFTARLALRNLGFVPKVRALPDPDLPNLVARVAWGERVPPVEYEKQLFAEVPRRRTHRGGFEPAPLPAALLEDLAREAAREKTTLRLLAGGPPCWERYPLVSCASWRSAPAEAGRTLRSLLAALHVRSPRGACATISRRACPVPVPGPSPSRCPALLLWRCDE